AYSVRWLPLPVVAETWRLAASSNGDDKMVSDVDGLCKSGPGGPTGRVRTEAPAPVHGLSEPRGADPSFCPCCGAQYRLHTLLSDETAGDRTARRQVRRALRAQLLGVRH